MAVLDRTEHTRRVRHSLMPWCCLPLQWPWAPEPSAGQVSRRNQGCRWTLWAAEISQQLWARRDHAMPSGTSQEQAPWATDSRTMARKEIGMWKSPRKGWYSVSLPSLRRSLEVRDGAEKRQQCWAKVVGVAEPKAEDRLHHAGWETCGLGWFVSSCLHLL